MRKITIGYVIKNGDHYYRVGHGLVDKQRHAGFFGSRADAEAWSAGTTERVVKVVRWVV